MSVIQRGTNDWADQTINNYKDVLGYSVARVLSNDNILLRDVNTGQFAYSTDRWTFFNENYETLRAAGAFD